MYASGLHAFLSVLSNNYIAVFQELVFTDLVLGGFLTGISLEVLHRLFRTLLKQEKMSHFSVLKNIS